VDSGRAASSAVLEEAPPGRREFAEARPRIGYPRLHVLVRREGWKVNIKRVYRLFKLEGLGVRTKKQKKRGSHLRLVPHPPMRANERWNMDFVQDSLMDDRKFRALTVVAGSPASSGTR